MSSEQSTNNEQGEPITSNAEIKPEAQEAGDNHESEIADPQQKQDEVMTETKEGEESECKEDPVEDDYKKELKALEERFENSIKELKEELEEAKNNCEKELELARINYEKDLTMAKMNSEKELELARINAEKEIEIAKAKLNEQKQIENNTWIAIYDKFIEVAIRDGTKLTELPGLVAMAFEQGLLPDNLPGVKVKRK